jgi:hypothetical protein
MGFQDYVDKMISFEKLTDKERRNVEEKILASIQASFGNSTHGLTTALSQLNTSEISRVNELAKLAMDTTDQSADAVKKREAAKQSLIDELGTDLATQMMQRYEGLSGNSKALANSIEASKAEYASNQENFLAASELGVKGINQESLLFSTIADNEIEGQKSRANELGNKIDDLLSSSDFLKNITSEELGQVLKSVQEGDQMRRNKLSKYKEESSGQIATLGGVIGSFATLVDLEIEKTRDYLDQLSSNFTRVSMTSGSLFNAVLGEAVTNISRIGARTDGINQTLHSDMLSIGPIQDGLNERLVELIENENKFAEKTRHDLGELVNRVAGMNSQISVGRVRGMQKLRNAITQLSDTFRTKAMEYQSQKADLVSRSSFFETNHKIVDDIKRRIESVRNFST